jgi:hypothetical protein
MGLTGYPLKIPATKIIIFLPQCVALGGWLERHESGKPMHICLFARQTNGRCNKINLTP